MFPPRLRRAGIGWVCATMPLVVAAGWLVHGERAYLLAWALLSGLYTTPALVITVLAARRAAPVDRPFWRLWSAGMGFLYITGISILLQVSTGIGAFRLPAGLAVASGAVAFTYALIMRMRTRSGGRALSLDLTEGAMVFVGMAAVAVLLVGQQVIASPSAWFAAPSVVASVGLLLALYWVSSLYARLEGSSRQVEAVGMALAIVGAIDGVAQAAQALSGFSLPAGPLFGLQAACLGLLLLMPLHAPSRAPVGLERLPPQAQVRESALTTVLTLLLSCTLLGGVFVRDHDTVWTVTVTVGAAALFGLSTLRHVLSTNETKRLYAKVEVLAEERRRLLSDAMHSADQDRHRVAAQLHQQAVSSYVAFVAYIQATGGIPTGEDGLPHTTALAAVRDDLGDQAESLRQLMLAVRPIETDRPGPSGLSIAITAYVHSLYGGAPAPDLRVEIDADLELGWTTETMVFRIVQEALRNVHRHAQAASVRISLSCGDLGVVVEVVDDGLGFDLDALLFESGIATMRSFAAFGGGTVVIESAPGQGTAVRVELSTDPPVSARPTQPLVAAAWPAPTGLRLVSNDPEPVELPVT